jgi:hypothetical protein
VQRDLARHGGQRPGNKVAVQTNDERRGVDGGSGAAENLPGLGVEDAHAGILQDDERGAVQLGDLIVRKQADGREGIR